MNSQINPLEILLVDSKKISCCGEKIDGVGGDGHPLVYLDMGKEDNITCPYCSKYFTIKKAEHLSQNKNQKKASN